MKSTKPKTVPFRGTKDQEKRLDDVIAKWKDKDGPLMPILQGAQDIYGYLPIEVQRHISEKLNMPLEKIYGVVTFYSQFSLYPKGKYKISVCLGTACYVKGAGDILERISINLDIDSGECTEDGLFSLDATRCLGCCGLAPVMTVNEDVYGKLSPDDIDGILGKYKKA